MLDLIKYIVNQFAENPDEVEYVVEDYLGKVDKISYTLNVTNSSLPIIKDMLFPQCVVSGTKFNFSDFYAVDYSGDGIKKETENSIQINYRGQTENAEDVEDI